MELKYCELDARSSEIRLLTLYPGSFQDAIRFTLWHTSLVVPSKAQRSRMTANELQKTLPPGWTATETHQYQHRFLFEEDQTENTSWTHPDPKCDPVFWQPLPELTPPDFQPAFEALSYTWGSDQEPENCMVEYVYPDRPSNFGDQEAMTLLIRKNLASALRHLRYPDKARILWIDAICINQKDDKERGRQVKFMSIIYKLASRVVVWLGSDSAGSQITMSTLHYLGSQLEVSRSQVRYRSPQALELDWFRAICPLPYSEKTWRAISDFLHRPWFERLWICQEIQLANAQATVVCGRQEFPWQCLRRAIICLFTKQELPLPELRRRLEILEQLTLEHLGSSFNILLSMSRERKCADPRDKIYGMLSLCGLKLASKIQPQYSLSVETVYKDVFLMHLGQVKRLDLLSGCDSTLQRIPGPSWVPDWSVPRTTWPLYGFTFASGVSCSHTRYVAPHVLQVTGCQAAIIRRVSEPVPLDSPEILDAVKKWVSNDLLEASYITGESLLDAYCKTLRVGWLEERWPSVGAPLLQAWKRQLQETLFSASTSLQNTDLANDADIRWCLKLIGGRKFIETEEGYIGLGPPGALPGDRACILLGCKVAMLLRPVSDEGFQVIGECYIHGLDDGIAILGPFPKDVRVQLDKIPSGYGVIHTYQNVKTGEVTDEDPRLQPPLSLTEWERIDRERQPDGPALFQCFRNRVTGSEIDSDPRLLPDALGTRGVKIRSFDLY